MTKTQTQWSDSENKELVRLYNHEDGYAIKETAYRLNQKFGTRRGTGAVGQQLGKLRKEKRPEPGLKLAKRNQWIAGKISDKAQRVMSAIDKAVHAKTNGKKGATPRRNGHARKANGGRDPLLTSESRVLEVAFGDKGSIRLEIRGPILLNEALVGNIASALTGALRI
jgi:hypothetical protein